MMPENIGHHCTTVEVQTVAVVVCGFRAGNLATSIPLSLSLPRQASSANDEFVYDVSRDGQRFLIITQVKHAETEPMSIVLNWPAKLNK